MDEFTQDFRAWMDARRLSCAEMAARLGKEEGTIQQWRSRGVPTRESVRTHVSQVMADYDAEREEAEKALDSLTLEVDAQRFDTWNRAALRAGKIMREWAVEGLDAMARDEPLLRVAEDPTIYRPDTHGQLTPREETALDQAAEEATCETLEEVDWDSLSPENQEDTADTDP